MKRGFACQENSDHKMMPGIFPFRKKLRQPVIKDRYDRRELRALILEGDKSF
jgi:hypothetical protein